MSICRGNSAKNPSIKGVCLLIKQIIWGQNLGKHGEKSKYFKKCCVIKEMGQNMVIT